jgi:hypothetical protein
LIRFDQLSAKKDQNCPVETTETSDSVSAQKKLKFLLLCKILVSKFEEKLFAGHLNILDASAEIFRYNRDAIECANSPIARKSQYRANMMLSLPVKAEAKYY